MRVLVTGGRGLLGGATVAALVRAGHSVRTLQRNPRGSHPAVDEILGDVRDVDTVRRACAGVDAVVHLAARVAVTGEWEEFRSINVAGTGNVVRCAREAGVSRVVHVSSPSVAHSGSALVGVGATPADPGSARGHYSRSKAVAELEALSADEPGFAVVAIRPHLVWGPGDTQLIGRIVDRARAGRLILVGSGSALIDTTYVDNAADALVCAVERAPADGVHGHAFVISNGEPRMVRELFERIAHAARVPGPKVRIPFSLAWGAGAVAQRIWRSNQSEPPITTFLAEQLATAHWFDQRQARAALDWSPRVMLDEGFALLRRALI